MNMLEVCIDSLESAHNAIKGGADELEICSSLIEGGLTPTPGLVLEVLKLVNDPSLLFKPKVNIMIRCRSGSDFCYTDQEMTTMLADVEVYKSYGIDRLVFGALTDKLDIDKTNCAKIIQKAIPLPVTFHRAFDLCANPTSAIEDVIALGFNRILTSGKQSSADNDDAIVLLRLLLQDFGNKIEIMPGAGINCYNVKKFVELGFKIIHSSCKKTKCLPNAGELNMGTNIIYVTDEIIVQKIKKTIKLS